MKHISDNEHPCVLYFLYVNWDIPIRKVNSNNIKSPVDRHWNFLDNQEMCIEC